LLFPPILISSSMLLNHPFGHTKDLFLLNFHSNSLHTVCSIHCFYVDKPPWSLLFCVFDSNVFYKTCS
jgi:hypothetical protein